MTRPLRRALAVLAAGALLPALAGCGQDGNQTTVTVSPTPEGSEVPLPAAPSSAPTPSGSPQGGGRLERPGPPQVVETVAQDLAVPWGLDFFPNGDALVTERDSTRVLRVTGERRVVQEVGTLDAAAPEGEGGALGLVISPDYPGDRGVYFYLTTATDNRIVRAELEGGVLGTPEVLLDGIPRGTIHDGGRLEFGPDGYLYASTGETGDPDLAQDRDSLAGKILRITPEGDPAPGNPFDSPVWSWGHRNVQGLAFDDRGRLWASEYGSDTADELNLVEAGGNYGWPLVEGVAPADAPGRDLVDPALTWSPEDASPSGLAYADGALWMGALRGERLWRVPVTGSMSGSAADAAEAVGRARGFLVGDLGRIRSVGAAPDGSLWITTSNRDGRGEPVEEDDRILRVSP